MLSVETRRLVSDLVRLLAFRLAAADPSAATES